MNFSSPSFMEIEFTIGLPWMHFRPASMTWNFEESTITGTRAMSGSRGDEVEELDHRLLGIEQALVHVDVDDLRAVRDLVAGDVERRREIAAGDELPELGRAGDVGALADVHERDVASSA